MNVYVGEISRALAAHQIQVDIFTRRKDPLAPEIACLDNNVRVIQISAGAAAELDKNLVFWHLREFFQNVLAFVEREGVAYDLIFSHYWLSGWVGTLLQSFWSVPHATMFHTTAKVKNLARVGESEKPLRIEVERKIIARADCIIAASANDRTQLIRQYDAAQRPISVVPCGVDLNRFHPRAQSEARRALGLGDGKIALFVGRPDPIKGLEILLQALAELEDSRGIQVVIVGGDQPEALAPYRKLAAKLGIAAQVRFEGAQPQAQLPLYYQAADVCVVPSYVETFGLVAVESMACGTPVLASRVGGLISTVRDGETGYLVPWRCAGPFAERLEILLGNDALRAQMAEACRPAMVRFSWPRVAVELLSVFERLLADWRRPKRAASGDGAVRLPSYDYGLDCHLFA